MTQLRPAASPFRSVLPRAALSAALLAAGIAAAGCSNMYYKTLESFGIHKRDVLADRVESGRDAEKDAGQQFKTTLAAFKAATGFQGGKLEDTYDKLNTEYERCVSSAAEVSDRIDAIEKVADDLFSEWKSEIGEMSNSQQRASDQQLLAQTKIRYGELIDAMKKAESRMPPVLTAFKDEVFYIKHNLNANAIASLQSNVTGIENDVAKLVSDMEISIAQADEFIKTMN